MLEVESFVNGQLLALEPLECQVPADPVACAAVATEAATAAAAAAGRGVGKAAFAGGAACVLATAWIANYFHGGHAAADSDLKYTADVCGSEMSSDAMLGMVSTLRA